MRSHGFFLFDEWLNDPTITQQLQFASSTIMPSSGLELFFDISCPSLRCQAGPRGSKGVQGGPRSHCSTDDLLPIPAPVSSSYVDKGPDSTSLAELLVYMRQIPWSLGVNKAIFLSFVDSMLEPFVCQLGTSNAIHALWRFSFTTSSAGC